MGRKKRVIVEQDLAGPTVEEAQAVLENAGIETGGDGLDDEVGDLEAELQGVASEFGKESQDVLKVQVFRVIEGRGERAFLFACTPSELPILDRLRDEYGGGRFDICLMNGRAVHRKFTVLVEAPKLREAAAPVNTSFNELARVMSEGFTRLGELIVVQNRTVAPAMDPAALLTSMVSALGSLKSLTVPAPSPSASQGPSGIELFIKGIEVAKELNSDSGETGFLDVVKELIRSPVFEKAVEATHPAPVAAVPRIAAVTQQHKPNGVGGNGDHEAMFIKQYVEMLLARAKRGCDPVLYAEFILDNVPVDMVKRYLINPTLMQDLVKIAPECGTYEKWFLQLRDALNDFLEGEDNAADVDGVDTEGGGGSAPDVASNEKNGIA